MKNFKTGKQFLPLLLLVFASSLFTTSCAWFKPARDSDKEKVYTDEDIGELQGTKVFDPETGEWRTVREVNGKVDTLKWKELKESDYPPIESNSAWTEGGGGSDNNDGTVSTGGEYDVSLVLPFLANQAQSGPIDENSYWAIHFYAGAKLAYESLAQKGVSLLVNVADSEGNNAKMNRVLNGTNLKNADLIIGPYKRNNVRLAEGYSKRNSIPLVVPYTAQLGLANGNSNYIQMNPSLRRHCEAITEHARAVYDTENIVLVARDRPEEKARFHYFQNTNAEMQGGAVDAHFREYAVADGDNGEYQIDLKPYISQGGTSVFLVPSWSDESFIYSFLRQLMIERAKGENIVVYGMPMWMDFDQIDYDFYRKLNVHVSSAIYIDNSDERVRQFKRKFFDTYGEIPNEEAYLGYDAMLYFGDMLNKYGKEFPKNIDRQPYDVLHGRFDFARVVLNPEKHKEDLNYYDQLENKFVHILQFEDFRFQPAR